MRSCCGKSLVIIPIESEFRYLTLCHEVIRITQEKKKDVSDVSDYVSDFFADESYGVPQSRIPRPEAATHASHNLNSVCKVRALVHSVLYILVYSYMILHTLIIITILQYKI